MKGEWKGYFPDDSETIEDAFVILTASDPEDAASQAVEYDWQSRSGWERAMGDEFNVVVVSPDGREFKFVGWHEPSVDHYCKAVK